MRFVGAWVVLVTAGLLAATGVVGEGLFDRLQPGDAPQVQSAARTGQQVLTEASPGGASAQLLLDGVDPRAPAVRDGVVALVDRLRALPDVLAVTSAYTSPPGTSSADPASSPLVASDGRGLLVTAQLRRGLDTSTERADLARLTDTMQARAWQLPGVRVLTGSVRGITDEINRQVPKDLRTGEVVALPASLLVMVVVFSGFLAAGLPLAGAIA